MVSHFTRNILLVVRSEPILLSLPGVLTQRGRRCYMWGLNRNGQTGTNIKVLCLTF